MRQATIHRQTAETDISLCLNLDGKGDSDIQTGLGFLDHMLTLFARHGAFDLTLRCDGDLRVDGHHSVEDIGICLGQAFREALGDKRGIRRYGDRLLPMDETLILAAVDISGRGQYHGALAIPSARVGDFDTELTDEFFIAFATNAGITLHLRQPAGQNSHHILEAAFKACARALREAVSIDEANAETVPSTKGVL